jgi:L-aspartate oxidase
MDEVSSILSSAGGPLRSARGLEEASLRLGSAGGATAEAEVARQLARMVLDAALVREESRGAHVRTDHPEEVDGWASSEVAVTRTGLRSGKRAAAIPCTPCA